MSSSFLISSGNATRLLQHARGNVNLSSCSNSGGSCCNSLSLQSRRHDRSSTFRSTVASFQERMSSTLTNGTSGTQRLETSSANLFTPVTRRRNVRMMSNKTLQNTQPPLNTVVSGHLSLAQRESNSSSIFLATALVTAVSGTCLVSSISAHTSKAEPADKTSTVATSAVASTLLPRIDTQLPNKYHLLNKASELREEMRDAVVSYQSKMIDEKKDCEKKLSSSTKKDGNESNAGKPYFVSVKALRGGRLYMEDEYYIEKGGRFTAVFDGHGGNAVSAALRDRLHTKINHYQQLEHDEELKSNGENIFSPTKRKQSVTSFIKAIQKAFREMDNEILMDDNMTFQGSTAVAIFLHEGENGERTIISANVGDSRAVLSRRQRAVDLTRDHKPNEKEEKKRITEMGEEVLWDHYSKVYRVRGLSLSRAFGDRTAKPAVSGEVEIKTFPLCSSNDDNFVVLASDGLWDVMSSQDVVTFVHNTLQGPFRGKIDLSQLSDEDRLRLMKERKRKMGRSIASKAYTLGSLDNICVVVVWLHDLDQSKRTDYNE